MKKRIDMINGKLLPEMLKFAIPIILSGILQTLYNAADALVIGRYESSYALGAVGSVSSIVNLLVNIFMGLAIGTNVVVARYFGQGDRRRVKKASDTAVVTAVVSGIIIGIIGFFMSDPVARLVKIDPEIIDMSITYMQIFFLGMPFSSLYNFIAATLRGIGDTKNPTISLVVSGAVNVVFNIIFVKYFKMGVAGVALATVVSQALAFAMIFVMLKKSEIGFSLKNIQFDKKILQLMSGIGIPSCIQSTTFSFSNTIMISAVNSFGAAAAAGHSVVLQVEGILYVAINALAQTVTTFTSQNIGAGNLDRAKKGTSTALAMSLGISFSISAVLWILAPQFARLFSQEAEVADFCVLFLRQNIFFLAIASFTQVYSGTLRGAGDSKTPMFIMLFSYVAFRQVYLFIVKQVCYTPNLVGFGYPAGWIVCATLTMLYYWFSGWDKKVKMN